MLGVSTFLGALGLIALLWGVRTGQFDDESKFIDGARYDNEEDLQDAKMMEEKRKERSETEKGVSTARIGWVIRTKPNSR